MSTLSPRVNSLLPNMRETLADKVFATGLMAGFILWLSLGVCLPFVSKTNTIQNLSEPGGMKTHYRTTLSLRVFPLPREAAGEKSDERI